MNSIKVVKPMTLVYKSWDLSRNKNSQDLGGNQTHNLRCDCSNSWATKLLGVRWWVVRYLYTSVLYADMVNTYIKALLKAPPRMTCCHLHVWLSVRCSNYLRLMLHQIVKPMTLSLVPRLHPAFQYWTLKSWMEPGDEAIWHINTSTIVVKTEQK